MAAACGGSDSSDDASDADSALAEVIEDLADEIDELNQQIDDLERENAESESSDGSDSGSEAERAAEMAACEGSHEMDGMYMPCDGHDEYVDNMEMIESVETVEVTEDGMYDTEAEALAAAAAMGCTGTHQMGDEYMMCGEHSEGEEAVLAIERIVEAPPADDDEGVLEVVIDDPAQMDIRVKDGRDIMVDAYYDGRPLNSIDGDVCIVLYNQYKNPTGCREGTVFDWSPQSWKVRCQTPINGSPKKFYSILMRDRSGTELARIEVSEDSPFAC